MHAAGAERGRRCIVARAQWLGTSLWFSPSGAADGLMARLAIDAAGFGWLIAATQLGFIAGTLAFAATGTGRPLRREPHLRRQLRRSAPPANAALALPDIGFAGAWVLRFVVGLSPRRHLSARHEDDRRSGSAAGRPRRSAGWSAC